jgi:nicotinamide-nucleotide amidase
VARRTLAANGIASHFHQHVGDNHERIVLAFRTALARSDAVIVCGGLGPTQDDITRAALAEVMNVPLERDEDIVATIRTMFNTRGREMPDNNLLQADVPRRRRDHRNRPAARRPGLICPWDKRSSTPCPACPTR